MGRPCYAGLRSAPAPLVTAGGVAGHVRSVIDMAKRTCSVPGCDRPHKARGWCDAHYKRWAIYGDPVGRASKPDLAGHFWGKVERSSPDSCWEWRAGRHRAGYGAYAIAQVQHPAHRVAYELEVGPIPDGLQLDHLCRNRGCVNPAHLEPVTPGENVLRGVSRSAQNARKTHCLNGHPFDEANTYRYSGPRGVQRRCKACNAARLRRLRAAG